MVRTLQRRVRLSSDDQVQRAFDVLFKSTAFFEDFHRRRGDVDVAVLDWIAGANQRLLTFSMCERDAGGAITDRTRCLETQTATVDAAAWRVVALLKPDSQVGSLFTIEILYACSRDSIVVDATVACLKQIWGFTGFVENILEARTAASLDLWCQLAEAALGAASADHRVVDVDSDSAGSEGAAAPAAAVAASSTALFGPSPGRSRSNGGKFNRNRRPRAPAAVRSVLPHKQLSTMKRVARGHDSVMRLLASGDLAFANSPSDDFVRRATAELDADVKENRGQRSAGRRTVCWALLLLLLLLVAGAAAWRSRQRQ